MMKPPLAVSVAVFGLLFAASAAADEAEPRGGAPAATPPATATGPGCRLSEHTGISDADATTAGRLVCAEIARSGAAPGERYRVSLVTLGSLFVLSVAREGDPVGSTADSRETTLHAIEEIAVAAPRIASSIVHGTPLPETQTAEPPAGQETRERQTKPGRVDFAVGLAGTFAPFDQGLSVSPGAFLDLRYEMNQVEFGGSLRFGGGSSSNTLPTVAFFAACLGGRFFTSDGDVSPYVGGGLSWSYYNLNVPAGFAGSNTGLGAYAESGVEVLRTHHTRLALGARVDLPFFALNSGSGSNGNVTGQQTFYYAPVSLEARITF
jgi:hypothetical protein